MAVIPEERYLKAVKRELLLRRQQLHADTRPLISIFFGGGTPSLLATTSIAGFLEQILELWPVTATCEITLEANPESATLEKMYAWREMGINRLSLGIQAFEQTRLQFLQRPHDLKSARRAIRQARQAGFTNINLDLIYATPGHTPDAWAKELAEALAWQPQHLSCYQLSIEPGTTFFQRSQDPDWMPMAEAMETTLFQQTRETLAQNGWSAYEISNFTALRQVATTNPSRQEQGSPKTLEFACRHNRNYWSFGDYLGIGSGAHGKLSTSGGKDATLQVWRSVNPRATEAYMASMETAGLQLPTIKVSATEAGRECLLMGLRHNEGVQLNLYRQLTGSNLLQCRAQSVKQLLAAGYLIADPERLILTEKGTLLADAITLELL